MSASPISVIIIGAGGQLGPAILKAFSADHRFAVSILSRKSSKSTFPSHMNVYRVSDDYPQEELVEAFKGKDAVISVIARAGTLKQKDIIDAAAKAGVKRFVPSEFGSDTENEKAYALLPQGFGGKRATVDHLKSKEAGGLTWSAFVTGPIFELAISSGFMGFDLKNHKATLFNGGKDTWSATTLGTIGLAVKNALLVPDKTANQYIFIDSFTITQNQVVAALEQATGQKWERENVGAEELKSTGLEKVSKGDHTGIVALIRYINCVHGHGGNYAEYRSTANALLETPKETLEEEVQKIVEGRKGYN